MEGFINSIEKEIQNINPIASVIIGLRVALRTVPTMITVSEGITKLTFPLAPFNYWPEDQRAIYLEAYLNLPKVLIEIIISDSLDYNAFQQLESVLYQSQESLDVARKAAKRRSICFDSHAKGDSYLAANMQALASVNAFSSLLQSVNTGPELASQRILRTKYDVATLKDSYSAAIAIATATPIPTQTPHQLKRQHVASRASSIAQRLKDLSNVAREPVSKDKARLALTEYAEVAEKAASIYKSLAKQSTVGTSEDIMNLLSEIPAIEESFESARLNLVPHFNEIGWDPSQEFSTEVFKTLSIQLQPDFQANFDKKITSNIEEISRLSKLAISTASSFTYEKEYSKQLNQLVSALGESTGKLCSLNVPEISKPLEIVWCIAEKIFNKHNYNIQEYLQETIDGNGNIADSAQYAAINCIVYASEVFYHNVSNYSDYDVRNLSEAFEHAIMNDLAYVKDHTAIDLLSTPLWPQQHDRNKNIEVNANRLEKWWLLWNCFKQESLQIDPALNTILEWYQNLLNGRFSSSSQNK